MKRCGLTAVGQRIDGNNAISGLAPGKSHMARGRPLRRASDHQVQPPVPAKADELLVREPNTRLDVGPPSNLAVPVNGSPSPDTNPR
ncbi:hypothetical protein GCM10020229_48310 [Kitasatospora albolonga]